MDRLSMKSKVPNSIKEKLNRYGVNLPTDGRYNDYKNILKEKKLNPREYISYLKDILAKLKKKEDTQIKKINNLICLMLFVQRFYQIYVHDVDNHKLPLSNGLF